MRRNIVALLAVALMCVCGAARPSIIYSVNITDGTETVTGTITTDGAITLVASDITAWAFTASGPVAFSINSSLIGASFGCASGCGLSGSVTELDYDFGNPLDMARFAVSPPNKVIFFEFGSVFLEDTLLMHSHEILFSHVVPIGFSASVPEPGTFTLLGLALAALGFSRRRKSN